MSYSLQQYRDMVRSHLDVDTEDIPDALVDAWCREATSAIVRHRTRWPFLQHDWDLTLAAGVSSYLLSDFVPPVDEVAAVTADNRTLTWVGPDDADWFGQVIETTSTPMYYSWWGPTLQVYPTPANEELVSVRGWRSVTDWPSEGAGAVADLPVEFGEVIRNRLLGEAYSQQEDPEMGQMYFSKAEALLVMLGKRLGVTPSAQPIVMGGGGGSSW